MLTTASSLDAIGRDRLRLCNRRQLTAYEKRGKMPRFSSEFRGILPRFSVAVSVEPLYNA